MQRIQIGPWEIEYDREATRAAYAAMSSDGYCDCQGCRNYLANMRTLPETARQFFNSLGIEPEKYSSLGCAIATGEDEFHYDGWYNFVGQHPSGEDIRLEYTHKLTENLWVGLTTSLALVPEVIPEKQALQLEFSASMPWLLNEPKEECYQYREGD